MSGAYVSGYEAFRAREHARRTSSQVMGPRAEPAKTSYPAPAVNPVRHRKRPAGDPAGLSICGQVGMAGPQRPRLRADGARKGLGRNWRLGGAVSGIWPCEWSAYGRLDIWIRPAKTAALRRASLLDDEAAYGRRTAARRFLAIVASVSLYGAGHTAATLAAAPCCVSVVRSQRAMLVLAQVSPDLYMHISCSGSPRRRLSRLPTSRVRLPLEFVLP